jgi:hypothetical protein
LEEDPAENRPFGERGFQFPCRVEVNFSLGAPFCGLYRALVELNLLEV